jgi:hypothetical protein
MAVEMTREVQEKLREKFDTRVIGLKPKIWCKLCSEKGKFGQTCENHKKKRCPNAPQGCGQNLTEAHLHIEFVSHSEVTDRLLQVDPFWQWEPLGFEPNGLPALDANGGLWIKLTVAGVTRIGYGGADGKRGDDGVKEAVSDAIKTTAMRFGVGLDLWRKSEESGKHDDEPPQQNGRPSGNSQPRQQRPPEKPKRSTDAEHALEEFDALCAAMHLDVAMAEKVFAEEHKGSNIRNATTPAHAAVIRKFLERIDSIDPTRLKKPAEVAS